MYWKYTVILWFNTYITHTIGLICQPDNYLIIFAHKFWFSPYIIFAFKHVLKFNKCVAAVITQIANFMGPTWGLTESCRPQVSPTLAPWTLLSGKNRVYESVSVIFAATPTDIFYQIIWILVLVILQITKSINIRHKPYDRGMDRAATDR